MSVTVKCPGCDSPTSLDPVTVVREGSPELEALFRSALNRCVCAGCGRQFLFETPIVYRDDDERCLIYLLPAAFTDSVDAAIQQVTQLYESIFGDFDEAERPDCRLTTNNTQFIEKIAIHQAGYDDRLIEYIKYQLFQHSPGLDPIRHQVLFDFSDTTGKQDKIRFIAFERETRNPAYSLEFGTKEYQQLEQVFVDGSGAADLEELFEPYYVRVDDLFF